MAASAPPAKGIRKDSVPKDIIESQRLTDLILVATRPLREIVAPLLFFPSLNEITIAFPTCRSQYSAGVFVASTDIALLVIWLTKVDCFNLFNLSG
jgi:hypothetical protein